jgi:enolase
MTAIIDIVGREVLDSRGNPTVEVDVHLEDGSMGRAMVPSGASTGAHEAVELRDGGGRYMGKGVEKAVAAVNGALRDNICGMDAEDQIALDKAMIALDGTANKASSAPTPFSACRCAVAKAAAEVSGLPLYRYVGGANARVLPVPMMNIINGGAHADNPIDIQEFMIMPVGAIRMPTPCAWVPRSSTRSRRNWRPGLSTNVGDEGGFAPKPESPRCARLHHEIDREGGYKAGEDVYLALDCAATEFFKDGKYELEGEGKSGRCPKPWPHTSPLVRRLSDHLDRGRHGRGRLGRLEGADRPASATRCQLVGDDLFVTNPSAWRDGASRRASPTRSWSRSTRSAPCRRRSPRSNMAHKARYTRDEPPLRRDRGRHHRRSGRGDQLRADQDRLAARSDRLAKYNQLIRIEEELEAAYREMLPLIRRFEEKAGQLYGMGLIGGFCHLYIGQEAVVVGMQMSREGRWRPGDHGSATTATCWRPAWTPRASWPS